MSAYKSLEDIYRRYSAIGGAMAMLDWDNSAMMPENSGGPRGEQMSVLAAVSHGMMTDPRLGDLFAKAKTETGLDDWQKANLREMERSWQHETALPPDLVTAMSKASHASELAWRKARKNNDFKSFVPYLEEVLKLSREAAAAKSDTLKLSPYDALLDQYDPGTKSAAVDVIFDDLATFLPSFIKEVREKQAKETPPTEPGGTFPAALQKKLGQLFMQQVGFDFTRGRLDESAHPFCGGVPGDVRLTTRYDEKDFLSGFFGIMHETGHAMYELGLPEQWRNQPVGFARGMAFHESQSLLSEMQLCIGQDFLTYATPIMRDTFGVSGAAWTPENIHRLMTRVQPSFIRVDADEVTYPCHIILRYRLEKDMIAGKLAVKDLPDAWAAQMQELLGIIPDTDSNGCLQDIHWPMGSFGYFPTYTLGAMTAAQLFATAKKAIPDFGAHIQKGDFKPLFSWLRENVHQMGSKLSSPDLLKHATGKTLDTSLYKAHLNLRYLDKA